ncbi:MAG: ATP-binding protein [Longimicrobiales bacterium]|nr:ATP-binding protein [Longimicrobiales bacterium]
MISRISPRVALAVLFLVPATHPLLIPFVGVSSHLLWFVHSVVVGAAAFAFGIRGVSVVTFASVVAVGAGEALFGAGYGEAADPAALVSLVIAVGSVDLLAGWTAVHARRRSEAFLDLFEHAPVALVSLDREGRVHALNHAACRLFGVARRRVGGLHLRNLIVSHDLEALAATRCDECEERIVIRDGEGTRPIHGIVRFERHQRSGGGLLMIQDRSMETNQRLELERQGRLAVLGEGLAGVAHELRNPLTVIMAYAELGSAEDLPEPSREALDVIRRESARMRDLVQELLGFSRARAEGGTLTPLVSTARRLLRVQQVSVGPGVEFELDAPEEEVFVTAEPSKVEQVLQNLITNAVQALDGTRSGVVRVRIEGDQDPPALTVEDNGPGIPTELLDHVFKPFVTTKPEGVGTGLGLPICRRLARGWGGDLTVDSPAGGGVTCHLSFTPTRVPVPQS